MSKTWVVGAAKPDSEVRDRRWLAVSLVLLLACAGYWACAKGYVASPFHASSSPTNAAASVSTPEIGDEPASPSDNVVTAAVERVPFGQPPAQVLRRGSTEYAEKLVQLAGTISQQSGVPLANLTERDYLLHLVGSYRGELEKRFEEKLQRKLETDGPFARLFPLSGRQGGSRGFVAGCVSALEDRAAEQGVMPTELPLSVRWDVVLTVLKRQPVERPEVPAPPVQQVAPQSRKPDAF